MLSLKKAKSWTDVEALEKSIVKSLGHDPRVQYAIERKHDGVALELIYSKYADGSVLAQILYWGFNPLWAFASVNRRTTVLVPW